MISHWTPKTWLNLTAWIKEKKVLLAGTQSIFLDDGIRYDGSPECTYIEFIAAPRLAHFSRIYLIVYEIF